MILDKPSPPRNPKVEEQRKTHIKLSWELPETDGGSEILGYIVERKTSSSSRWIRCNKSPVNELTMTITDVMESTKYIFKIIAVNKIGESEPTETEPVTAKDPWDRPDKPEPPSASNIKDTSMKLNWIAPDDGGSEIINYILEMKAEDTIGWTKVSQGKIRDLLFDVRKLKKGSLYEFRVAAENCAGQGPFSDPCKPVKSEEKLG